MKVYLAAIAGHVPPKMVQCFSALMDFCYIARRNAISSHNLNRLQELLDQFHECRKIFADTGITKKLSAPRQHALVHYIRSIELFGALNGLCSSITESQHIRSIKKPWRHSSRHNPLPQMTQKVLRLEKLAALRSSLEAQGLMWGTTSQYMACTLPTSDRPLDGCSHSDNKDRDHSDCGDSYEGDGYDYSNSDLARYSNVKSDKYDDSDDSNDDSGTNPEENGKCLYSLPLFVLSLLQKTLIPTLCFLVAMILKQRMAELRIQP